MQGVVWEWVARADEKWGVWAGEEAFSAPVLRATHKLFSSKVDRILRQALSAPGLAAMSAVIIHNDTVLWTGNFGRKNGSDPASGPPNEYTMYRSAGGPPMQGARDGRTKGT